ncbi:hypothetical protein [Sphingomonas turrisvirgatae]|nr:hypothetical protein [Sphingomonas turrisvirgatae]
MTVKRKVLRGVIALYALAAVVAWAMALCGAMGWFGADGLAGIWAILLAMPWSWAMSWVSGPPVVGLTIVAAGMAVNVAVLVRVAR